MVIFNHDITRSFRNILLTKTIHTNKLAMYSIKHKPKNHENISHKTSKI